MKTKRYRKGSKIPITINGREIITVIDSQGVQRLPCNSVLRHLLCDDNTPYTMNWLAEEVCMKRISEKDRRFIYQNIGYSVCGYADVFPRDRIKNPLWDEARGK